ncbi:MAG: sulfite exporter TauE/SafE family protein, partial [Saprospiraceae bacterium]|nr:sulfite exporter TauE/SafE family protein [Saprospiraceae bacterium]
LLLGLLGKGLFVASIQKGFSLFLGLLLLVLVLFKINLESQFIKLPIIHRYTQFIKKALSQQIRRRNSHFTLGLLNGLLPCGLVYLALAGAITTATPWQGALFMLFFGLGTMPLMIGVFFVKNTLTHKIKHHLRHIASFVMLSVALLLIFRGFSIQFPTELRFWEAINHPVMCH